jgi:capsular polysaccharide biosynthesis protein
LEITVQDADPVLAKQIADEMAEVAAAFISEKMDQDPPSIIQYGYSDGAKVSPSIRKNTLLGVILGAILAMAVVVILYLLNDTVMTQEDVEKKLGLNLLSAIPLEESEDDSDSQPKSKSKKRKG